MIQLSVIIPMFNAAEIAWLPMESLIRQKEVPCEWEIVTVEEQNGKQFGEARLMKYMGALQKVGCSRVSYLPLREWVPLSQKWRLMSKLSSAGSEVTVFQAADNFLHPYGVHDAFEYVAKKGADWIAQSKMPWWFLTTGGIFLADSAKAIDRFGKVHPAGLWFSARAGLVKQLPFSTKAKGVDRWLVTEIGDIAGRDGKKFRNERYPADNDHWKLSFGTHGLNTISRKREEYHAAHYCRGDEFKSLWPPEIVERVEAFVGRGRAKPLLLPGQKPRQRLSLKEKRLTRGKRKAAVKEGYRPRRAK
jgi:hypothetical protein